MAAATIFGLSAVPGSAYPPIGLTGTDKVVHLFIYAVLGALVARGALLRRSRASMRRPLWLAFVVTALYGATDELHQLVVPHRSADPLDLIADVAGAAVGVTIARASALRRSRRAL